MSKQYIAYAPEPGQASSNQRRDSEPDRPFQPRNTHYDDEEFSLDV